METNELVNFFNNPENLNEETLEGIKKLTEDFPYSQSLWMLYLKNLQVNNHHDLNARLRENAIRIADRKKLYYLLNQGLKNQAGSFKSYGNREGFTFIDNIFSLESETYSPPAEGTDLIDNFISKRPTIKIKNDEGTFSQADFSEGSIVENDEIITETFANILVQQKKYDKAIESFEKLSLRFPEKSIYFAGRIEEIQKLKDN
jgi:hypothetical protein